MPHSFSVHSFKQFSRLRWLHYPSTLNKHVFFLSNDGAKSELSHLTAAPNTKLQHITTADCILVPLNEMILLLYMYDFPYYETVFLVYVEMLLRIQKSFTLSEIDDSNQLISKLFFFFFLELQGPQIVHKILWQVEFSGLILKDAILYTDYGYLRYFQHIVTLISL